MSQFFGQNENYSFKELYDVVLKTTYNLRIGDREFEPGEVIAEFDKIIMSTTQEIKVHTAARGGYDNRALVNWDDTKEVVFTFSQGVFNTTQFGLMSNSQLLEMIPQEDKVALINEKYETQSDENGEFVLDIEAYKDAPIFFYNKKSGRKIKEVFEIDPEKKLYRIMLPFTELLVRYTKAYTDYVTSVIIGRQLTNGYLSLEGKTRLKDDNTGRVVTGLVVIPRLKLMSDLIMRLGTEANPVVANFTATGYPVGVKGNKSVMEIVSLNDDIDADIV